MAAFDFPATPTVGQVYAPTGSPAYIWDGTKWVTSGYTGGVPTAGLRNVVINGNFDIWQRTLPGVGTGTRFTADRWFVSSNGSTTTPSVNNETPGALAGPGEPRYFHGTVVASVAAAGNFALLATRIEGVRTLAGQQCTLSFTAWADAAKPISAEILQVFGTGGSPSAAVSVPIGKVTLSTVSQRYALTFTMPSISGKTIGSNIDDYIELRFWLDAGSTFNTQSSNLGQQSGTFYHSGIQLEPGAVVTPFERRPYGVELELCQRYYETGTTYMGFACPSTGGFACDFHFVFKVTKRTIPTVNRTDSAFVNVSTINPLSTTVDGSGVQLVGTGLANVTGTTAWTAAAEI